MNNVERQKELRKKLDSGDDKDLFRYGACHFLALEIHLETKKKFSIRYCNSNGDDIAHVWCFDPVKQVGIDACGRSSEGKIVEFGWGPPKTMTLEQLEKTISNLGISCLETEIRDRAKSFIAHQLIENLSV